jgi:shikimate kinase
MTFAIPGDPLLDPTGKIFLVGFMGSGKTSLGRLLAGRMGWTFFDLDAALEEAEGASIMRIFVEKGEAYFRSVEQLTLREIAERPVHAIVACGGGTFCSPENQSLLRRHGLTVWLDQPFDRIWQRREELARRRPLWRGEGPLRELYDSRVPFYQLAGVHLPVEEDQVPQAVERLLAILRERHGVR